MPKTLNEYFTTEMAKDLARLGVLAGRYVHKNAFNKHVSFEVGYTMVGVSASASSLAAAIKRMVEIAKKEPSDA